MAINTAVEMFLDGVWTDITDDVRADDAGRIATITRGRPDEARQVDPSSCALTLDNPARKYSPRNPTSILYGKIGRNTPIRVKYDGTVRFSGEIPAWPQAAGTAGTDAWVPINAAGIMRRLGQGGSTPRSAPARYIPTTNPTAYWPMEDGPDARQSEPLIGTFPFISTGDEMPVEFGAGDLGDHLLPGAKGTTSTANTKMSGNPLGPQTADDWAVDLVFRELDALSGTVLEVVDNGARTAADPGYAWEITTHSDADALPELELRVTENDGTPVTTLLGTTIILNGALTDERTHHLRLAVRQISTTVGWFVYLDGVLVLSDSLTSTTNHGVGSVRIRTWGAGVGSTAYGHIAVHHIPVGGGTLPSVTDAAAVALGSVGEPAGRRIERLCAEEGIPFTSTGDLDETQGMGAQPVAGFLELIRECEAADMGLLFEPRATLGLHYTTRAALYNQTADATFAYASRVFVATPVPVDDDQQIRNDVTVSRSGGSSHNAVDDDGPLGVTAVGRYDEAVTVNIAGDGNMLENQAGWRLHLGTVDEERYPDLEFITDVLTTPATLDIGDRLTITGIPGAINEISQLAQGFTETLYRTRRDITINCVPESPYRVAQYNAVSATGWKYESGGTERQGTAITSTQTSITFTITAGPFWTTTAGEFPFDINVGGERMTVTAIAAPSGSTQLFTVTRSVNGVVKSHPAGTTVALWKRSVYAL